MFYIFLACLTFILSFIFCFLVIKLCAKFNIYDKQGGRKIHSGNIPRLGGVAIFLSFFISYIILIATNKDMIHDYSSVLVLVGALIIFIVGLIDDLVTLKARFKLLFQILAALCVAFTPYTFHNLFGLNLPMIVGKIFTIGWIIFAINAYNLIDGIDWVCGGFSLLNISSLLIILFLKNDVVIHYFALVPFALLGFLIWNKPKAKIFLGDCGSTTLGYVIAIMPLMIVCDETVNYNNMLYCAVFSGLPCIDVIACVWRRLREHRGIFSADRGHIHHKLINIGFSKWAVILFLLSFQLVICIVCISSSFLAKNECMIILWCTFAFIVIFFTAIHYVNRAVNLKKVGHLEDIVEKGI